jgi:hypothetical protein
MKNILATSVLTLLIGMSAMAGDKAPFEKEVRLGNISPKFAPSYVTIKTTLTDKLPQLNYSTGNASLGLTLSGAIQTKDAKDLDKLLGSVKMKKLHDGGLEIDIDDSDTKKCALTSDSNGAVAQVSGECLTLIQIDFAGDNTLPLILNGISMHLND